MRMPLTRWWTLGAAALAAAGCAGDAAQRVPARSAESIQAEIQTLIPPA
jgi:hypothetical protein